MSGELIVAVTGMNAGESPQPGPAVVRSLREAPGFQGRIAGLLYDALESGVYVEGFLDHAFVMPYPSSGSDALLSRIDAIRKRIPFEVLIPTLDAELPAFVRLEERLRERGVRMFIPTEDQLEARSKARLDELCRRMGISAPRQSLASSLEMLPSLLIEYGGEAVVKGAYYEAGIARNGAEAVKIGGKIAARWGFPLIVQEKITGEEYDYAILGDGEGGVTGGVAMKKMALTEKGKAFGGMTIDDAAIREIGRKVVAHTRWKGPLELEFVKAARDGKYYLIEINPRFPAWIYLATGCGQNLPWAVVRMALGGKVPSFPEPTPGRFFIRHAMDIVSDIAKIEKLTVEGELHS